MAKINPLSEWVVATREEASNKTASGFYLPDNAKEQPKVAVVESAGAAVKTVKKGDRILFKEYSTTEVKLDGTEYILVKEEDILATVK
ncbi:TPA: co-chaperone GroES [Candidatus Saccharibacteria bacterium]|nr:co-chaperone GroES [Candidatus Saccharibacteria bacterium]HIO87794.1 co-chaperone GroES [Candidatus Saccharibacteria bacterium]